MTPAYPDNVTVNFGDIVQTISFIEKPSHEELPFWFKIMDERSMKYYYSLFCFWNVLQICLSEADPTNRSGKNTGRLIISNAQKKLSVLRILAMYDV